MADSSMWWQDRREAIMALCTNSSPLLVYNEETLNDLFFDLLSIDSIDRCFYPVPANPYPGIIKKAFEMGMDFLISDTDEEKHVRSSCPGITAARFFFTPEPLSFPKVSIGGSGHHSWDLSASLRRKWDIRDYSKEIERAREEHQGFELWFACGPEELSPVGALITRVAGHMKVKGGFLVPLGKDLSDRMIKRDGALSMEIFNFSDYDRNTTPLPYGTETDRLTGEVNCRIEASAYINEKDCVIIPGMGAFQRKNRQDTTSTGKNQGNECFLRARALCQVKI